MVSICVFDGMFFDVSGSLIMLLLTFACMLDFCVFSGIKTSGLAGTGPRRQCMAREYLFYLGLAKDIDLGTPGKKRVMHDD